jgi:hypothetical protein
MIDFFGFDFVGILILLYTLIYLLFDALQTPKIEKIFNCFSNTNSTSSNKKLQELVKKMHVEEPSVESIEIEVSEIFGR